MTWLWIKRDSIAYWTRQSRRTISLKGAWHDKSCTLVHQQRRSWDGMQFLDRISSQTPSRWCMIQSEAHNTVSHHRYDSTIPARSSSSKIILWILGECETTRRISSRCTATNCWVVLQLMFIIFQISSVISQLLLCHCSFHDDMIMYISSNKENKYLVSVQNSYRGREREPDLLLSQIHIYLVS